MKQVTINLYSFSELDKDAKQTAISDHNNFMRDTPISIENEHGELIEEYIEPEKSEIIENIEINDYLFYKSGKLSYCTTYTGKHEKSGTTEFHLGGETYTIS
jgi:hypothetical protein